MSLSGNDRAFAVYKSIANTSALTGAVDASGRPTPDLITQPDGTQGPSEKYKLLLGLQTLYSADTTYLTQNAEVLPGTLAADTKIPVSVTGGPAAQSGFSTAPGPLVATSRGKVL